MFEIAVDGSNSRRGIGEARARHGRVEISLDFAFAYSPMLIERGATSGFPVHTPPFQKALSKQLHGARRARFARTVPPWTSTTRRSADQKCARLVRHGRARPRTQVNALRRMARETLQKITEACPGHPRVFSACRKAGARRGRDQAALGRGASNSFAVRGDRARKGVVRARSRTNGREAERHGGKIGSFQGPD